MLHPSHPAYEKEYPTASTEFALYGRIDHPEDQLEKKWVHGLDKDQHRRSAKQSRI
jgi:hypothetical protein